MEPNYFVCTLGQATALDSGPKAYRTVSEFLAHQSKHCGSRPAVGFAVPHFHGEWSHQIFSFQDVDRKAQLAAYRLSKSFKLSGHSSRTIALLCHSSPEFLFTWLGLIRLGFSVLLVAPQCQPAAILHLCKTCNVSLLLHDEWHSQKAGETLALCHSASQNDLVSGLIPQSLDEENNTTESHNIDLPEIEKDEGSIAYLHHTSGTSSGLPKPIPQSHRAAIGILPHLPGGTSKATFTTTPLYHGGIADTFRAWTSDSMIWLFPGKAVPITAHNIRKCLDVASSMASTKACPEVKYFSSVPYVLQMMEMEEIGVLKNMDIVGVGGAALPAEVGNRLVAKGVNLISRFGSAECGFLLSSHRDFGADKEWQYLRNYNPLGLLEFEPHSDGLSELVIRRGWPHMAKLNRDDGSFATADLFAQHPKFGNAWLYLSRADSQLTLITGKKFDPAPLEDAIATSDLLDDVLIFGNGRPCPGALLFRSTRSTEMSDEELIKAIWPSLAHLNQESQYHARIPRRMLVVVPHQTETLEKSSKGTIIRKTAEERFKEYINAAYDLKVDDTKISIKDEDVSQHLLDLIQSVVPKAGQLSVESDLFSYGVDSISSMHLRTHIHSLIPPCDEDLPLSIVEECGTVRGLSDYIIRRRRGENIVGIADEEQLMRDLVKQYGTFDNQNNVPDTDLDTHTPKSRHKAVVLTGATGALGAYILDQLRSDNTVTSIYCLVRAADKSAARERVNEALGQRGLMDLSPSKQNDKVRVVPARLGEPQLGLSSDMYHELATEVNLVLHVAWTVNFRIKLQSFATENLAGLRNLIDLALASPHARRSRFAFCSSTAAIINGKPSLDGTLAESLPYDPASASPLGYSRSKWVAEMICDQAHEHTQLRDNIVIIRVGQLSGDSKNGIWNTKEAWPMMLNTAKLIGALPNLGAEPLDWLPVDIAAKAFLEASNIASFSEVHVPVYHVLNPHRQPTWDDMLSLLRGKESFEVVDPTEWVRRLELSEDTTHPARKLLPLWRDSYGNDVGPEKKIRPQLSIARTTMDREQLPTMGGVQPLNKEYLWKIWEWVHANVR